MISFYLDEVALIVALRLAKSADSAIEKMTDAMEEIHASYGCFFYAPPNVYETEVNGEVLAQIIFAGGADRDLILRVQRALDTAHVQEFAPTGDSFAVAALRGNQSGGLVSNIDYTDSGWWLPDLMVSIACRPEFPVAVRTLFVAMKIEENQFEDFLAAMFPNLYFHQKPSAKKLGLKHVEVVGDLIKHLGWLNDCAAKVMADNLGQAIAIAASEGILISPESPNTHKDKAAMAERTITLNGKSICCEWHTKFEKTIGRLHFDAFVNGRHADVVALAGNKVIIGVVAPHLK